MARITVEECLDHVENRFELVMVASKRARQIATQGKDPMVDVADDTEVANFFHALKKDGEGTIF